MKRWLALFAALVIAVLFACSGKVRESAGLQLIIATDLATPEELDQVRIEVRQQTGPGRWGAPFVKELRVPSDITLPTSFAITAGKGDNNAQIRLVGKKNTLPVVLSVVETRVPTDRVATLQLTLARACTGQLTVDVNGAAQSSCPNASEACQAETGQCGPVIADSSKLPNYRDGDEDRAVARAADAGPRDAASDAPILRASKDITRFSLLGVDATIAGTAINVQLPTGSVVTSVAPVIEINGVSVSPASGAPQDFTSPVSYTVTAEDGSTRRYTVTVSVAPSTAKEITSFEILGVKGIIGASTIDVALPFGTDPTALLPTFTITGVLASPASGVIRNFTSPVEYTVQAADGSVKKYLVTVSVAPNPAKEITKFTLSGVDAAIAGTSITVTVPSGTSVTSLVPTIVHLGASIAPAALTPRNFSSPVQYTVTAADGSTKTYTVTVTVPGGTAKDITAFSINGVLGTIVGANITVTLPFGTSVLALSPNVAITGTSVAPASGAQQDFTAPVVYTVTAADSSTKTFTVTVTVAGNNAKDITAFSILGNAGNIVGNNINVTVPSGTDVSALIPSISITGASVSPGSGVARNFTNPVTYTVTAGDASTKSYQVTVTVAASSQKDITSFVINGVSGNIVGQNISLTLPFGTDVTNLTPTIQFTGVSVNPPSGTPRNFSGGQTYTVTASDSSTKVYSVTVSVAPSSQKDITSFSISGTLGVINGTAISVTMPAGTNVTSLTPTIGINGVSVNPANGTPQDFTNPVNYVVTAADTTTKIYVVTVTVAGSSQKDITSFVINGVSGQINQGMQQILVTLPPGTDRSSLVPSIIHTGMSVSPPSGLAQNFNSPVVYTVTAADLSTKPYTVTVVVNGNSSDKEITSFIINGVSGTINHAGGQIFLTLPKGTDRSALQPAIMHTGSTINPPDGTTQSFNNPVIYTVHAADLTTKQYTVYVDVVGSDDKQITSFNINGTNGTINEGAGTIQVVLPPGTNVTALAPTIMHTGKSIAPPSGALQDFSNPVPYTVTAINNSTRVYTVTVTTSGPGCTPVGAERCNFACLGPTTVCVERCDMTGIWTIQQNCQIPTGAPPPPACQLGPPPSCTIP